MRGIFFLLLLAVPTLTSAAPPESVLRFGIVPQVSPSQSAALWEPLLTHLSEQIGVTLQFQTARDLATFEQRVSAGDFDFAYLNPFHYTVVHKSVGYKAFARESGRELRGIIVVAANAPFQGLADLNNQRLAVPGLSAFAATLIPLKVLSQRQITVQPAVVSSHESVMLSVARGVHPAGGTIQTMLDNTDPALRTQLRVLWRSDAYTSHPFVAHPRVEQALLARLLAAMRAMADTKAGKELLDRLNFNGLDTANDRDYDAIRQLDGVAPVPAVK